MYVNEYESCKAELKKQIEMYRWIEIGERKSDEITLQD